MRQRRRTSGRGRWAGLPASRWFGAFSDLAPLSSTRLAWSVKQWRTGSSATSSATCKGTWESVVTSGIRIGAPTTASCFRRKSEAATSVRTWSAATACSKEGQEAQWCIFDPIMSAIYGDRYLRLGIASDIENQIAYFNRSLGQITSTLRCPEAYFIECCEYVPNDNVPLRWTQANLWLALKLMKSTAG